MLSSSSAGFLEDVLIISGNLLVQVVYGVNMVFLNHVFSAGVSPLFLVVFGNLATAVFLLPFAAAFERKKWPAKLSATLLFRLLLISLGGVTLFQALTLVGVKKASPEVASAMPNLAPGLIFLIAACLRFERFDVWCWYSRTKVTGTLVCLTGAIMMCILQSPLESPSSTKTLSDLLTKPLSLKKAIHNDWVLGCLSLLAGVVLLSCTTVLQAATMLQFPAPLSLVVTTCMMGSSLTALLQLLTEGKIDAGSSTLSNASIGGLVILVGVVCGSCASLQTWSVNKKGPLLVAIFSPIQTVTAIALSAVLLGQFISFGSLAGAVLMFAGLYVILWAKNKEDFCTKFPIEDVEKPLLSSTPANSSECPQAERRGQFLHKDIAWYSITSHQSQV